MEALVRKIVADSAAELTGDIEAFCRDYGANKSFDDLSSELRDEFWETLFNNFSEEKDEELRKKCLSTLRILSRDKVDLDKLVTTARLNSILDLAHLSKALDEKASHNDVAIEAVKILCNLVFNSTSVHRQLLETACLKSLVSRMQSYTIETPFELKFFDCRLLFLISALDKASRTVLKVDLSADSAMTKLLSDICAHYEGERQASFTPDDLGLCCEVLKALFNLYISAQDAENVSLERSRNLVLVLFKLLVLNSTESENELQKNIANLLIVLPFASYKSIVPLPTRESRVIYRSADVTAIQVLLDYLDRRLNVRENLVENLSPILSAFIRLVKVEKSIRRYARIQILPPLKDVMTRPEEGTTLRAKLCKLLTCPIPELKDLVAELLFVLCKENVTRMIKYTGYGNAAGMFANKGLLAPNTHRDNESSESEESDTEEYEKHKDGINPVTGCYERPKPSPLEGMSEEQKEYEAMQLIGLVDKLTRGGVIQPCRIGEDGKPKPIEHVLELQEELPKHQLKRRDSESD